MATESKVKWDLQQLNESIQNLKGEHRNLEIHRDYLRNIDGTVTANWQSPAARQYLERMSTDIVNLNGILKELSEQIDALSKVKDCYSKCEGEIVSSLRRLSNSI